MRYTKARMKNQKIFTDIDKDTVDCQNNFDDSLKEPSVLPSRFQTLLNGGTECCRYNQHSPQSF